MQLVLVLFLQVLRSSAISVSTPIEWNRIGKNTFLKNLLMFYKVPKHLLVHNVAVKIERVDSECEIKTIHCDITN